MNRRASPPFARSKLALVSAVALARSALNCFDVVPVNRFGGVRGVGVRVLRRSSSMATPIQISTPAKSPRFWSFLT
jgi:hypothetical protein